MSNTPWMDVAKREIGESEITGSNDNPRIIEYHKHTSGKATDDETAWCAAFVCFCLDKAGLSSTKSAWARSYLSYGRKGDGSYGDIAVFWRDAPNSSKGHVGFVDHVNGDKIYVLGGNQTGAVRIAPQPKSQLLAYRRPAKAGSEGTSQPKARPTLQHGSKGEPVKTLQKLLNKHGADLEVDGDFGDKTERAVRVFQKHEHIDVDGVVGPITWRHLLDT